MTDAAPVVAIDGPSGVGKSTVARHLARRLRVPYIDTGAMYRALAWKSLREGKEPGSAHDAADVAGRTTLDWVEIDGESRLLLDGEPVDDRLRRDDVSLAASQVAAVPAVRRRLVALQRRAAENAGGVLEGRDIGTVVFPGTPHKFFLDAAPAERVRRRFLQLRETDPTVDIGSVRADLEERDRRDRERPHSPLSCDSSYRVVDCTGLSVAEVVAALETAVRSHV